MTQIRAFGASVCLAMILCLAAQTVGSMTESPTPRDPLEQAAQEGNAEQVTRLLAQEQSQYLRDSALRFAIRAGRREVAELLISQGARYALMIAAEVGDVSFAKDLLAKGADANERDSALHAAARTGHKEVVELLLSQGANANATRFGDCTSLFVAAAAGCDLNQLQLFANFPLSPWPGHSAARERSPANPEAFRGIVELLIKHGADVNVREKQHGFVSLHYAVFGGSREVVAALLDGGAPANPPVPAGSQSGRYLSPLHLAAHYGDLAICELLVARDAEVNAKLPTQGGMWIYNILRTPLHHAAESGNGKLVSFLVDHSAEVNAADSGGQTPLHGACEHADASAVETLLAHEATVNAADGKGRTALHYAAERKDLAIVKLLVSHGADPARKSRDGQTPTSIATQNGSDEIVRLLTVRQDRITIHSAASMGDIAALERLVKEGTDVNRLDVQGQTALHAAANAGQLEAVRWLVEHGAWLDLADDKDATALSIAMRQAYEANVNLSGESNAAAVERQYKAVMAFLISRGARADLSYGLPSKTVQSHSAEIADLLIEAGTDFEHWGDSQATLLHRAAWWGQAKAVDELIALGADFNAPDRMGGTPLHAATQEGSTRYWDVISGPHTEVMELLLKNGAKVDAANNSGQTALHGAASHQDVNAVTLLIEHGANVNAVDRENQTPLHRALAWNPIPAAAGLLLDRGADANMRFPDGVLPVYRAAAKQQREMVDVLSRHGARADAALLRTLLETGTTPLHEVAEKGDVEQVRKLLDGGMEANIPSRWGSLPIQLAHARGHQEVVNLLIPRTSKTVLEALRLGEANDGRGEPVRPLIVGGVDINAHDSLRRETPLHQAVGKGDIEAVKSLIALGADINAKDKNNETPLGAAVFRGQKEIVALFLSHGAEVNNAYTSNDLRDCIPLHIAMRFRHAEIAEMLVKAGSDVNARGGYGGMTPLHLALDNRALFELMLEHGGRIDAPSSNGMACLHMAAAAGEEELARYLLGKGASVNLQDNQGNTPLHWAAQGGHGKLCRVLLDHKADIHIKNNKGLLPLHYAQASDSNDIIVDLTPKSR